MGGTHIPYLLRFVHSNPEQWTLREQQALVKTCQKSLLGKESALLDEELVVDYELMISHLWLAGR